jgi:phosphoribosylamine--glycine ligase
MGIGKSGAKNAAVLALRILALSDESLHGKLIRHAEEMEEQVAAKNRTLQG